jgi:nitrite reductase/ring-hydroxylating ferredoxin subunit
MFRFDDGKCVDGPCKGASLDAVKVKIDSDALVVFDAAAS